MKTTKVARSLMSKERLKAPDIRGKKLAVKETEEGKEQY